MIKEKLSFKKAIKVVVILIITLIAGYGLIKAPSRGSDHLEENLKKEFANNQKMLKNQEAEQAVAEEEAVDDRITFVGDSVMLGAVPDLMAAIPDSVIDAKESRQASDGIEICKYLKKENNLTKTVVIELGVNCYFNPSTGQELIDYLGKNREIYWVRVYGKYLPDKDRTNQVIAELAKANPNVHEIAWDVEAEKHPEWFYNDGIHLNGAGRKAFAQVMCDGLGIQPAEQTDTTEQTDSMQQGE